MAYASSPINNKRSLPIDSYEDLSASHSSQPQLKKRKTYQADLESVQDPVTSISDFFTRTWQKIKDFTKQATPTSSFNNTIPLPDSMEEDTFGISETPVREHMTELEGYRVPVESPTNGEMLRMKKDVQTSEDIPFGRVEQPVAGPSRTSNTADAEQDNNASTSDAEPLIIDLTSGTPPRSTRLKQHLRPESPDPIALVPQSRNTSYYNPHTPYRGREAERRHGRPGFDSAPRGLQIAPGFDKPNGLPKVMSFKPDTRRLARNKMMRDAYPAQSQKMLSTAYPEPQPIRFEDYTKMVAGVKTDTPSSSANRPRMRYVNRQHKAEPTGADELEKRFRAQGVNIQSLKVSDAGTIKKRGGRAGLKNIEPSMILPAVQPMVKGDAHLSRVLRRVKKPVEKSPFNLENFEKELREIKEKDREAEENARKAAAPAVAPVPVLTEDMRKEAEAALANKRFKSQIAREQVEFKDLRLLGPGQWLNDEVINFYMALLQQRADKEMIEVDGKKQKKRDIHCFNSFFYSKLAQDYAASKVGRWTKKIDIFAKDVIVFPINKGNTHWICGAINFKDKRLECYDSLGTPSSEVYKRLRKYLDAEHMDKKKTPFDFTGWTDYQDNASPQQNNGSDCGVFSCQTLEHRARGVGDGDDAASGAAWEFSQDDMKDVRKLMVYEIAKAELVPRGHV